MGVVSVVAYGLAAQRDFNWTIEKQCRLQIKFSQTRVVNAAFFKFSEFSTTLKCV